MAVVPPIVPPGAETRNTYEALSPAERITICQRDENARLVEVSHAIALLNNHLPQLLAIGGEFVGPSMRGTTDELPPAIGGPLVEALAEAAILVRERFRATNAANKLA